MDVREIGVKLFLVYHSILVRIDLIKDCVKFLLHAVSQTDFVNALFDGVRVGEPGPDILVVDNGVSIRAHRPWRQDRVNVRHDFN